MIPQFSFFIAKSNVICQQQTSNENSNNNNNECDRDGATLSVRNGNEH